MLLFLLNNDNKSGRTVTLQDNETQLRDLSISRQSFTRPRMTEDIEEFIKQARTMPSNCCQDLSIILEEASHFSELFSKLKMSYIEEDTREK